MNATALGASTRRFPLDEASPSGRLPSAVHCLADELSEGVDAHDEHRSFLGRFGLILVFFFVLLAANRSVELRVGVAGLCCDRRRLRTWHGELRPLQADLLLSQG